MRQVFIRAFAIFSLFVTANVAYAKQVTWYFEGVVSIASIAGGTEAFTPDIKVGDPFAGSLTFDDVLPNTFATYDPHLGFELQISGHAFRSTGWIESSRYGPPGYLQLDSLTGPAVYAAPGFETVATIDGMGMYFIAPVIAVDGVFGPVPRDASLLTPVNWHWFQIAYQTTAIGAQPFYGGDVTFLSAPVPEPETCALFFSGLGVLVVASRRKLDSQSRT